MCTLLCWMFCQVCSEMYCIYPPPPLGGLSLDIWWNWLRHLSHRPVCPSRTLKILCPNQLSTITLDSAQCPLFPDIFLIHLSITISDKCPHLILGIPMKKRWGNLAQWRHVLTNICVVGWVISSNVWDRDRAYIHEGGLWGTMAVCVERRGFAFTICDHCVTGLLRWSRWHCRVRYQESVMWHRRCVMWDYMDEVCPCVWHVMRHMRCVICDMWRCMWGMW